MSKGTEQPTAERLVEWWATGSAKHRALKVCPSCGVDVSTTGITKLVYTFEVCSCGDPAYEHLVEQLWHRSCFLLVGSVVPRSAN